MCRIISLFIVAVTLAVMAHADDLSQGGPGTNLEIQKGFAINTLIDQSGKPSGFVYGNLGAKFSQVPANPQTDLSQGSTALWPNQFQAVAYFVSGVVAALSIYYICSISMGSANVADLSDNDATVSKTTDKAEEKDKEKNKDKDNKEETKKDKESSSSTSSAPSKSRSRTRRETNTRKADADLNRLSSIVLSAINGGECLKKSICLIGSQMSEMGQNQSQQQSKNARSSFFLQARMADGVLKTVLPKSVQSNSYYTILRRSFLGELSCDRFSCNH